MVRTRTPKMTFREFKLSELGVVFNLAQRPLKTGKVRAIASDFVLEHAAPLTISDVIPGDNRRHVIDGQHRLAAMRSLDDPNMKIKCKVLVGVDDEEECARRFVQLNTRTTRPHALDLFNINVTAGEELEVGIDSILQEHGWRCGTRHNFRPVTTAIRVAGQHGLEHFRDVMAVDTDTWGKREVSSESVIIGGLSMFLDKYGSRVDRGRLAHKLRRAYGSPSTFVAAVNMMAVAFPNRDTAACEVLKTVYNNGLRSNRLE